jgi:hypothetical protein
MNQKLFALKGDFYWRAKGSTGPFKPFLNATAGEIGMTIETQKQRSNGDVPGTIAEDEINREATFSATFQSRHKDNMKHFLYANSVEVAASSSPIAFTLPAGVDGDTVDLGHANITDATFGSLVEGTDYTLKANSGAIVYLTTVAETEGTFEHDAYTLFGVFSADAVEVEILFTSEKSGQSYKLYRVKLSPAQTLQLVSDGTEYGSAQLTGTLLIDTTAPTDGTLGQYGRVRSVA